MHKDRLIFFFNQNLKKIKKNVEYLYSANRMLCALHIRYPWLLDLLIRAPFNAPPPSVANTAL